MEWWFELMDRNMGLGLLVALAAIIVPVGIFHEVTSNLTCTDVSTQTGLSTKYSTISGCYVRIDGQWVPVSKWRTNKEGKP